MKTDIKHSFAYYLPQYHEVKENNEWWGNGFTEWTKLGQAKPYSNSQVILTPGNLGYYNLDDVNVIGKQYKIANKYGVNTFCFWHYWFNDNELLLEKPAELLIESSIDVNFCFAWANHSWWNKTENKLLKTQHYDFSLDLHFDYLARFFKDKRYRKINNKPVFFIFDPRNCPILYEMVICFNNKAKNIGFDGVHFIFENTNADDAYVQLCDNFLNSAQYLKRRSVFRKIYDKYIYKYICKIVKKPRFYDYKSCVKGINEHIQKSTKEIPFVFPGWDSTIRHGVNGVCLNNSTPENFKGHLIETASRIYPDKSFIVIKSWNEWAEGNTLEPSYQYDYKYLEAFSEVFNLLDDK